MGNCILVRVNRQDMRHGISREGNSRLVLCTLTSLASPYHRQQLLLAAASIRFLLLCHHAADSLAFPSFFPFTSRSFPDDKK
jgi:hypothetical protein